MRRPVVQLMRPLREFYQRYRQYISTDALMYLVFAVVLGLLMIFFG